MDVGGNIVLIGCVTLVHLAKMLLLLSGAQNKRKLSNCVPALTLEPYKPAHPMVSVADQDAVWNLWQKPPELSKHSL